MSSPNDQRRVTLGNEDAARIEVGLTIAAHRFADVYVNAFRDVGTFSHAEIEQISDSVERLVRVYLDDALFTAEAKLIVVIAKSKMKLLRLAREPQAPI